MTFFTNGIQALQQKKCVNPKGIQALQQKKCVNHMVDYNEK